MKIDESMIAESDGELKSDEQLIAEAEMTPCMGVCVADGNTGWCFGCGRTQVEIDDWQMFDAATKTDLGVELKGRVSELLERRKAERAAGGGASARRGRNRRLKV
ncbi:DUF1289 domain-containing protein [Aliamphritea ceti]|uniref:DUF1289 domain-containing protein n=1 Tax=Aliamphritea ceti TaxID=1524258 RepID=UPI0021C2850B|nr:DUF1289 domain-containing protein [Aliamphritea ceti]